MGHEDMRLAINLVTYQRPDGRSPFYLKRALDAVFAQTHKDFKLYFIGDQYENHEEFINIVTRYPLDRIYFENLPIAMERSRYTGSNKHILWCTGGTYAVNHAYNLAIKDDFDYICHLDHDDHWTPNHLELISNTINNTGADWLCTLSTYQGGLFPLVESTDKLVPFLPLYEGLIHSSSCYNYRTIPLRARNTYEEMGEAIPADADLWLRMSKYIVDNRLTSFLINEQTCFHDEEGYLLK
jgi:glycosyltransferase involved in cell wall biosynthesis